MRLLKKMLLLGISLTIFLRKDLVVQAYPTPIFDSLTPNLKEIMILDGEKYLRSQVSSETPKEFAEWELNREHVVIDGTLYKDQGCRMKLTDEDIESLYNLPHVKDLELEWFDLKDVDITKLLNINNNRTIKCMSVHSCSFSLPDSEIRSIISERGYTVLEGFRFLFAWPGVDPEDLFDDGRLKNSK